MRELLSNKKVMVGVIVSVIVLGYAFLRITHYDSLNMEKYSQHIAEKVVGKDNVFSCVYYEQDKPGAEKKEIVIPGTKEQGKKDDKEVFVYLNIVADQKESKEATIKDCEKKALEIFKSLTKKAKNEEFDHFSIAFQTEEKKMILTIKMDRERINELDFSSYSIDNLKTDATQYNLH